MQQIKKTDKKASYFFLQTCLAVGTSKLFDQSQKIIFR